MRVPNFVEALEMGLRAHNETDTWGGDVVHMSDLAVILSGGDEKCSRQVFHRINGHARGEDSIGQMMMFDHGHRIHERVTQLVTDPLLIQGWEITGVEVPVDGLLPTWMKGTLDLKLRGPEGEKVIVDWKTTSGKSFRYMNSPKPSNVIQLQGYMMVEDADYGILVYVDREGSNTPVQFIVERDDAMVMEGIEMLKQINGTDKAPPRMLPKVQIGKNKGPDGVKLSLPWQCQYCPYLDKACPGALKPEVRDQIVGYRDGHDLIMKDRYDYLHDAVLMLLEERGK